MEMNKKKLNNSELLIQQVEKRIKLEFLLLIERLEKNKNADEIIAEIKKELEK